MSFLKIAALCPTWRHPVALANSLTLWDQQDYPAELRHLYILDDGQTFDAQQGDTWTLESAETRYPSMPDKYKRLAAMAPDADAYLIWDDDEIYLPGYVRAHAACLERWEYSKPTCCYAHYGGNVGFQDTCPFHSAIGFRRTLAERVGWYPETRLGIFDQMFMGRLKDGAESMASPWGTPQATQYMLGFYGVPEHHSSGAITGPNDDTWYERNEQRLLPVERVGKLVPARDWRTKEALVELARQRGQDSTHYDEPSVPASR